MSDSMAEQQSSPVPPDPTRLQLDQQRIEFGKTVKNYFPVLFVLTVVIAASLILLSALGFFLQRTMDATVLAASVQVAFGMVLGFVCVYIGLMMTWLGIDAAYSVKGDLGAGAFVLKSASPGLLFALGGMVLVSVSLHKKIEFQEGGYDFAGARSIDPQVSQGAVVPGTPTNMIVMPAGAKNPTPHMESPGASTAPSTTFSGQLQFDSTPPNLAPSSGN